MNTRYMKLAGVLLSALLAAACGNGPELVDQTQPNYVKKADLLQGTWYLQDTVIDVPPTSALTFVGFQNDVEKVRFEIQEDYLVAYRTYEIFPGSDATVDQKKSTIGNVVTTEGKPYRGAPVAAWRIESHFDRIRSYNPATGEQSNVLTENTTDRPWYERDYIRVNWASNPLTNWNAATGGFGTDGIKGMASYVQPIDDEKGDDALTINRDAAGNIDYFDFTVRQYWEPETYDYPGYGKIPYCWLNQTVDCRGAVIKVRTSVRRVDEKHVADYEPLVYGDNLMKKFGYFRLGWNMERPTYDRNYGATMSGRLTYAIRHNIWERAHDENGNVIPVEQRQPKPIVYYLSDNYPKDMMPSARDMEASWDKAFRRAVAVPRGLKISDVPQMFYVCENPVPAGAPAACGPEGRHVRLGDLRYHMLNWVDQPQMAGPLGYGPSGTDPETGEIIHAVANIYGAGMDTIGGNTLQLLDVMTGQISLEDLIAGKDVKDFLAENRSPTDPRRPSGPAQSKQGLINDATQKPASFAAITGTLKNRIDGFKAKGSLPLAKSDRRAVAADIIRQHPALEAELINAPEIRTAVIAAAPGETFRNRLLSDPAYYAKVARDTVLRFHEIERLWKAREDFASRNNIWLAEFSDGAYIWMAKDIQKYFQDQMTAYQAQGKSPAEARTLAKTDAWTKVRNGLNRFIAEHEVGHTLGLMHNFIATFDAMNYQDGYWEQRKSTIGVMAGGQRVLPLTPQDLMDAAQPTEEQLNNGMPTLQYSSVMDYTARFPNHPHGVGKYDEAAILFAYSGGSEPGWVEVFNETRAHTEGESAWTDPNNKVPTTNMAKPLTVRGAHTEIPLAQVEHYSPLQTFYTDKFHYTTLPFHFADKNQPFEQALEQGIARMQSRSFRRWSEMKELYEQIETYLTDHYTSGGSLRDSDYTRAQMVVGQVRKLRQSVGKDVPVEVPFMYCSDYEVGANLACNRYDAGADFYEMSRDWIERYNDYYVFSNFRRDRVFYNPMSVYQSKLGRYSMNLTNVYQHWLYTIYWYQFYYKLTADQMEEFLSAGDPIFQNYWTMGVFDGVNHILGEMVTPSAGYFGKDKTTNTWVYLTENNGENTRFSAADEQQLKDALTTGTNAKYSEIVYVPRGPGRNQYTLMDKSGYGFEGRVNEMGHFWDQYGALIAMTESQTNFVGVDQGADFLRYSIPYFTTFPKELTHTVTGVWLEDGKSIASQLVKTGDGLATVKIPPLVRAEQYVIGFEYPPKAEPLPVGDPTPVELIEPTPTWSTRFFSHVFGVVYFRDAFNQDYVHQTKVFVLGSGENVTPADGYELVTFEDPFNGGRIFAAMQKVGGQNPPPAAQAVKKAQQLAFDWQYKVEQSQNPALTEAERAEFARQAAEYEGKVRESIRTVEMMRALAGIFDNAWL